LYFLNFFNEWWGCCLPPPFSGFPHHLFRLSFQQFDKLFYKVSFPPQESLKMLQSSWFTFSVSTWHGTIF
jgi:hypothetical protein